MVDWFVDDAVGDTDRLLVMVGVQEWVGVVMGGRSINTHLSMGTVPYIPPRVARVVAQPTTGVEVAISKA